MNRKAVFDDALQAAQDHISVACDEVRSIDVAGESDSRDDIVRLLRNAHAELCTLYHNREFDGTNENEAA